jgi:hypothetical protein
VPASRRPPGFVAPTPNVRSGAKVLLLARDHEIKDPTILEQL